MRSFVFLLSLLASACAYQVLTPGNAVGWTTSGPNTVTWQRVVTDPTNFTMLLVNQSVLPSGQELLIAQVDGTLGNLTVPSPSGGFPPGAGFQVNFVKSPQDLNTIYAQSGQFSINQSTTSTTSSSLNTVQAPITTAGFPAQTTDTSGTTTPTSSLTNTTAPGKNGADRITAAGSAGLIFAALVAFVL
ncbi:hypothetical protein F5148DRAFT_20699 [Russula earlei]|uniref:Uncharacterized protein n=1 Tax=Russula earlei TaxID=71964 RepID=A0ACC0U9J8_9AGAM|nr:hypothetical protein F5148DRAFT_20699 [Russula earlei]